MRRIALLTLTFLLLALVLTGCRRGEVSIDRDAGTLSVTLTESDINTALKTILAARPNPLFRDPSADLQPGVIVLNGQHERRDGQGTVSGTVTLRPSVVDGAVHVSVEGVSVEDVDASDTRVQTFAEDLAALLNNQSSLRERRTTITALTITDSALEITFSR